MLNSVVRVIELILLSAGAITTLLILKGATIPYSCELVFSSLMGFWNSIRCFLSSPLYICIIINFMIVLIAVSSHFHHHETKNHDDDDGITVNLDEHDVQSYKSQLPPPAPPPREVTGATPPPPLQARSTKITTSTETLQNSLEKSNLSSPKPLFSNWDFTKEPQEFKKTTNPLNPSSKSNLPSPKPLFSNWDFSQEAQEFKKTTNPLKPSSKSNLSSPKPLFSNWDFSQEAQEFNRTTIQLNPSSESTKLKMGTENSPKMEAEVTDSDKEKEEEDTIEATWKLITGGGNQKPKKKELKKSEAWVSPPRTNNVEVQQIESEEFLPSVKLKDLRKSETFNDTVSIRRNGGLRRDPSVSLDELNKQFEEFIKKFNADMRLQRQESDQRFLEMTS